MREIDERILCVHEHTSIFYQVDGQCSEFFPNPVKLIWNLAAFGSGDHQIRSVCLSTIWLVVAIISRPFCKDTFVRIYRIFVHQTGQVRKLQCVLSYTF
jgi:hypothetical protein